MDFFPHPSPHRYHKAKVDQATLVARVPTAKCLFPSLGTSLNLCGGTEMGPLLNFEAGSAFSN